MQPDMTPRTETALKLGLALLIAALIIFIYVIKMDSWRLRRQVRLLTAEIRRERQAIDLLRARRAHLLRPERIERLARHHLHMRPMRPQQISSGRE